MLSRKTTTELLKKANVNIVGTLPDRIFVGVEKKLPISALMEKDIIPMKIDGIPTDVFQVGVIEALRTGRYRPAPGGVSIGHYQITAGTLGATVLKDGRKMILSNNHVLANSNSAKIGDPIYQPGPHDGGTQEDAIAKLHKFVPIKWTGTNLVDCALADPMRQGDVIPDILEIGSPQAFGEVKLGDRVQKSGRTTAYTVGVVQLTDATVKVSYGGGLVATFEDQYVTTNMLAGGDSGSLLCKGGKLPPPPPDDDSDCIFSKGFAGMWNGVWWALGRKTRFKPVVPYQEESITAVGLCFAGSNSTSIHNKIQNVVEALDGFDWPIPE